ncbi:hypothetical protein [Brachybacterium sp. GPGPB12]|uniref:hypothetical protein n=1 Tax=Brachybacterium sp. GPGPB12 TaxID=3023517 RepID=UPI0031342876
MQMVVVSSPTPEETTVGGGSWYALGRDGERLALLVPGEDGGEVREAHPAPSRTRCARR